MITPDLHKQVGPWCLVGGLELPGRWPDLPEGQGELDLGVVELFWALPLAKLSWDGCSLDYLDARRPNPMTGSHLSVHLLNSTIQSSVTVFLVHVVITSSTLIPQPNPIILDCGWVLLKNLQWHAAKHNEGQYKVFSPFTIRRANTAYWSRSLIYIYITHPHIFVVNLMINIRIWTWY